ncbi:ankyrin repeat ph and sec7 domain containing protein secg-related [Anaeramoeba flamelloides]|uniref:Ankyrin repeat ph and sec7 domain containing protein secg-related n=1 Tax=Anaeramoeba flamelloides TaxID=1746091 RepID=A0AAV8AKA1_9EUKA|nr:ankyrin repeat ph and sec7 domain containing protein secg-related [Anaeramoeba flamelloides]
MDRKGFPSSIINKQLEDIQKIDKKHLLNYRGLDGSTLLSVAVEHKKGHEIVNYLCEIGINPNIKNQNKKTCLHYLCSIKKPNYLIVECLLKHGADPNSFNEDQQNCLHLLVLNKNFDTKHNHQKKKKKKKKIKKIFSLLFHYNANPNQFDNYLLTPFHYLCKSSSKFENENTMKDVITIFLKNGANPNLRGNTKYSPLHFLCGVKYSNTEHTKLLLNYGADPNLANELSWIALHFCAIRDNINLETISLLLKKGANPNLKEKNHGNTPLHLVCKRLLDCLKKNLK